MAAVPGVKAKAKLIADAKREPGAYISREHRFLYRVVGPDGNMLRVENAKTGNEVSLTAAEVHAAKLERGPEQLDCPDYLPDQLAA